MRREAFTAALCWFIGGALAVTLRDNASAQSVSRLYRNMPSGVYASGAPYGAYSFQIPFVAAPKAAASRITPVQENYVIHNMNAHLKDSYGNRFVQPSHQQSVAFKPFPQQYVQLQELPAHFAQPLAAPSYSYKQDAPQIIVGSQYRLPLQTVPTPVKQYNFPQGLYAGNIKSIAPPAILHSQFASPFQLPGQFNFGIPPQNHQRLATPPAPVPSQHDPSNAQQHSTSKEANYANSKSEEYHHNFGSPPQKHQRLATSSQHEPPNAQQQSTSNEAIYANTQSKEYHHSDEQDQPKYERLQEASRDVHSEEELSTPTHHIEHSDKVVHKPLPVPVRETTITSVMNGKKTRVNLKTKPPLPLLDISLLEPLTFDNPLVPQVQHFLPRINQATYHKLPEFTQTVAKKHHKSNGVHTKNYDSDDDKVKPKKYTPKKKQKYPQVEIQNSYYDEIPSASTVRPVITIKGTPNESPEFSYEINSPNYKETYTEQAINYNKETQSEPVHITYGTQKHEEPVHYTYVHSSKEPVHIKEVHYEGKGEGPKHLIHHSKPEHNEESNNESEESNEEDGPPSHHQSDHNHNGENNEHRDHDNKKQHHQNEQNRDHLNQHHDHHNQHHDHHNQHDGHHNQYNDHHIQHHDHHQNHHSQHHESPNQSHPKPEHREEEYHHKPSSAPHQNEQHNAQPTYKPSSVQYFTKTSSGFQPVQQFEEEIRIAAPIKVNPNQHVQSEPRQHLQPVPRQHLQSAPAPQPQNYNSSPGEFQHSAPHQKSHAPTTHVHEKTKQIIIEEETPVHSEHTAQVMFGNEENNEKDFERAYKNAAFGFPAYGKTVDVEKDIYNPASYGIPRDLSDFDNKNSPFQQYHDQNDNFPKSSRLTYKDDRDKTKEDYFLDFTVSRPESLTDRYKHKVDYYKLYSKQKPEKYTVHDDDSQKKQKTSEKYTAIPYNFYPTQDKKFFAQYKMTPLVQEFDYSKGEPRDNSAHSSKPFHRYKSNTFFVEPQFQYGFEPISIPRLLDSELATMASNDSPESEKPGMRKKIYKENFYIKKTSMSERGPNS